MSFWTQPENLNRGDNPNWNPAPPTEAQRKEAELFAVQSMARANAELERLQAERLERRRKMKSEALQDDEEESE